MRPLPLIVKRVYNLCRIMIFILGKPRFFDFFDLAHWLLILTADVKKTEDERRMKKKW